jgi:hypothetical protein
LDILRDSIRPDSILADSGFAQFEILPDSILLDFILPDSGFAEFDILLDSFLPDSILPDSGFAEFDILLDSFLPDSILPDSGFAHFTFLPDSVLAESAPPFFALDHETTALPGFGQNENVAQFLPGAPNSPPGLGKPSDFSSFFFFLLPFANFNRVFFFFLSFFLSSCGCALFENGSWLTQLTQTIFFIMKLLRSGRNRLLPFQAISVRQ